MSSGRRAVMAALAAALLVMTTGCGSEGSSSPKVTANNPAALMEFTSPAIGGGTVDGATLAGRPTLLWFWAPW